MSKEIIASEETKLKKRKFIEITYGFYQIDKSRQHFNDIVQIADSISRLFAIQMYKTQIFESYTGQAGYSSIDPDRQNRDTNELRLSDNLNSFEKPLLYFGLESNYHSYYDEQDYRSCNFPVYSGGYVDGVYSDKFDGIYNILYISINSNLLFEFEEKLKNIGLEYLELSRETKENEELSETETDEKTLPEIYCKKVFVSRNGQHLGRFTEAKVAEMLQNSEISENDFIFRQGDTEWSKVGSLYPNLNLQILKLTIKTGLQIGWKLSDYTPTETVFVRVVDDNIEVFRRDYAEQFYARFFGENWRSGNSDGSKYQVLDEQIQKLTISELASGEWRQPYTRLYLVKKDKLEKVDLDEFENPVILVKNAVSSDSMNFAGKSPEETNVLKTLIRYLNNEITPKILLRTLVQHERWKVPFNMTDDSSPKLNIFTDNEGNRGLYIFSDLAQCKNYADKTPGQVLSFLTLRGDAVFGLEISDLDFLVVNGFTETAVTYTPEHYDRLKSVSSSVAIEDKLRQLHAGNRDPALITEIAEYKFYFGVNSSVVMTEGNSPIFLINDSFGETTLPIFTSSDFFDEFETIYCDKFNMYNSSLVTELFAGEDIGVRALVVAPNNIVFNLYSSEALEFDVKLADLLVAG